VRMLLMPILAIKKSITPSNGPTSITVSASQRPTSGVRLGGKACRLRLDHARGSRREALWSGLENARTDEMLLMVNKN
jgi:hypothetical protein